MTVTFPTTIDNFGTISAGTKQSTAIGGRDHRAFHNDIGDALEAIETKIGVGASAQAPPNSGFLLAADGAGLSSWRKAVFSDLAANAASQVVHVAGSASGPTTSSGTLGDIPNIEITMTTVDGSAVLLLFNATLYSNTAGATATLALRYDSSDVVLASLSAPVVNYAFPGAVHLFVTGLTAGVPHTFKARWSTSGGVLTSTGIERRMTAIEFRR